MIKNNSRGQIPKTKRQRDREGNPGRVTKYSSAVDGGILRDTEPPEHLEGLARDKWQGLAETLADAGLLEELDRDGLASYCLCFADLWAAVEQIKKDGTTFTTDSGYIMKHPAVTMKNDALRQMQSLAKEYGLTPAARARLRVDNEGPTETDKEAEAVFNE
jgi:P27 family predicted phage terminase small subunit